MKTVRRCAVVVFLLALGSALSFANDPGKHPAYLHALSELRHARANLDRLTPSDRIDDEEQRAIAEIDRAIAEIKHASVDDGKDLNDHPPIDAHLGHRGRYHRALELLDKARNDIAREEDDSWARGLRNRAIEHIEGAHRIVDHLIIQAAND